MTDEERLTECRRVTITGMTEGQMVETGSVTVGRSAGRLRGFAGGVCFELLIIVCLPFW
jgi:hypothetical protein